MTWAAGPPPSGALPTSGPVKASGLGLQASVASRRPSALAARLAHDAQRPRPTPPLSATLLCCALLRPTPTQFRRRLRSLPETRGSSAHPGRRVAVAARYPRSI